MKTIELSRFKSRRWISVAILFFFLPALLPCGCADMTPQQKAAWGAGLGALAGAAIGGAADSHNRGQGALIGAGVGAMLGGTVGYSIGKYQEQQLASREEVERELAEQRAAQYQAQHGTAAPPMPQEPLVKIEKMSVTPDKVTGGSEVSISATIVAAGPVDTPPTGKVQLLKDNQVLFESPLKIQHNGGRDHFSHSLTLPQDASSGPYMVVIVLNYGTSQDEQTSNLIVS